MRGDERLARPRTLRAAALAALAASSLAACAPTPRPPVLAEASSAREAPATEETRRLAPAAVAHAERLLERAEAAHDANDPAGAQILGERSLAALEHARAMARLVRADRDGSAARRSLAASQIEVARLEADVRRVGAEADELELRVKVERDAQPIVPSPEADAKREKARREAARALALQARLLCGAARLLGGTSPGLEGAELELRKLEVRVADDRPPAPIDGASRARAACLSALTVSRRSSADPARAPGGADELLARLSAAGGHTPRRDDRGVIVTLRGPLAGPPLSPPVERALGDLGRVAAAHPRFPVQVVVHDAPGGGPRGERSRALGEAVARALRAAGAARIDVLSAGDAAPLVVGKGRGRERNERIDIVFVSPEAT